MGAALRLGNRIACSFSKVARLVSCPSQAADPSPRTRSGRPVMSRESDRPSEEAHHARTAGLKLGRAAGSALRGIVATRDRPVSFTVCVSGNVARVAWLEDEPDAAA